MPPASDIAVIGAGPHALAVVLHLLAADPSRREQLAVFDPSGRWLAQWTDAFERLDIATLRSPGVHHPDPDPEGLGRFVRVTGRRGSGLPYAIPTHSSFTAFCAHLVAANGLEGAVTPTRVRRILPEDGHLRLVLDDSTTTARRVVLATNPHRRVIPPWVYGLLPIEPRAIAHADDVDLRGLDLGGETVAVVGGGLSAAHLVLGATARGARVHWISRRAVRSRMFDVEPGWLGPKYLDAFEALRDPAARLAAVRSARDGGSVPPWMLDRLDAPRLAGAWEPIVGTIAGAHRHDGSVLLDVEGGRGMRVDRVWLATGTEPTLDAFGALEPVRPDIVTIDGFPVPDADLRIGPYPIHITGRLATIRLGPAAGNLWGAQRAAEVIARACTGVDLTAERAAAADVRVFRSAT